MIWVPTPQALVEKMLDMAKVTADDYVIDLGSGDGRTVIAAAKRGAKALGIEYNPDMVELSKRNAEKEGVAGKANFMKADLFESDFSQATVITHVPAADINLKLRPKILDLKPGTRIVSHAFTMDDWQADQTESFDGRTAYHVDRAGEGRRQLAARPRGAGAEAELSERDRHLRGGGNPVDDHQRQAARRSDFSFSAGNTEYTGRVNGNTIEGTMRGAQLRALARDAHGRQACRGEIVAQSRSIRRASSATGCMSR